MKSFRLFLGFVWAVLGLAVLHLALHAGPVPTNKPAAYPAWWFEQDVIKRSPVAANKPDPVWPTDYPPADDYAALNQGQLKHTAKQAYNALTAALAQAGGAGATLDAQWANPATSTDDFAAINLGQLKAVAKPFYDRLNQLDASIVYPWTNATAPADNYALANIGQLKRVFSFDPRSITPIDPEPTLQPPAEVALAVENASQVRVSWRDLNVSETGYAVEKFSPVSQRWERVADLPANSITWVDMQLSGYAGNRYRVVSLAVGLEVPSAEVQLADTLHLGVPDWWQMRYFGQLGIDPNADANGNGVSNRDEYFEGTDPTLNFYQGVAPQLTVIDGDHQIPIPGEFLRHPFIIQVLQPDGTPWVGAPVRFAASAEEGLLALEPTESARLSLTLTVNTDANGMVQVWLKCP